MSGGIRTPIQFALHKILNVVRCSKEKEQSTVISIIGNRIANETRLTSKLHNK